VRAVFKRGFGKMRIYLENDVVTEARKRVERIFDEFENVGVWFSGGKDSTCVLELAIEVARKKNRLPVPVFFIDQEIEWEHTIEYAREVMNRPEVKPMWFQIPLVIFNATTHDKNAEWLDCWGEGKEWVRPKEDISIKENTFGTDRFYELFDAITEYYYGAEKCALFGGLRAEETPKRAVAVTANCCYKDITWGKMLNNGNVHKDCHFSFYPIYDWSYTDDFKFIFSNGYNYNQIYNFQFAKGVPVQNMRVSNLNHETALTNLDYLQEFEPKMWEKTVQRLNGVNTYKHCKVEECIPTELPYMFKSWKEYIF
jgi:predicted phosphoadenosine phosphosulfate sulfurtransferase